MEQLGLHADGTTEVNEAVELCNSTVPSVVMVDVSSLNGWAVVDEIVGAGWTDFTSLVAIGVGHTGVPLSRNVFARTFRKPFNPKELAECLRLLAWRRGIALLSPGS